MEIYPLYGTLCTEFFDLDKPNPPVQDYEFYKSYVEKATGAILEPMCGSGRYLIPLYQAGYDVEGFDASLSMLNALKQKCTAQGVAPRVQHSFLETFASPNQYALIFIPDSSFSLFLEEKDILNSLQAIYSLLEPGGTFVFDVETVYAAPSKIGLWQGKVHTRPDGSFLIFSTLPLPVENNRATVICRYELCDKGVILKTEIEYFQIKLYTAGEMLSLLKKVGFTSVKEIRAFNHFQKPLLNDYTIVYECIK